ncbi:hypothetical protein FOA52_003603 [Chlamydomonas sp. UWO 241]|nr:hypothetical protein FOA52_003603 [Chlamydomonas sp. UWO 241]
MPGRLVTGLRRMPHDEFLLEQAGHMAQELALKRSAFESPERRPSVLVAEPSSIEAQSECLELLLAYLPQHYPDLYAVAGEGAGRTVAVAPSGEVYRVADYHACPLELCARLVQEDLVLLRVDDSCGDSSHTEARARGGGSGGDGAAGGSGSNGEAGGDSGSSESASRGASKSAGGGGGGGGGGSGASGSSRASASGRRRYVMSAAAVVFSFGGLREKLLQPLTFLHAPVPAFESELLELVTRTFDTLKPGAPLWRNNWGLSNTGDLVLVSDGMRDSQSTAPRDRWLRTEYETLSRLPTSGAILFTIRTLTEPLASLGRVPRAAACLGSSLKGMTPGLQAYKGLGTPSEVSELLSYVAQLEAEAHARAADECGVATVQALAAGGAAAGAN